MQNDEMRLVASTTENKTDSGVNPLPQLLGNMEKVAGKLIYFHLKFGVRMMAPWTVVNHRCIFEAIGQLLFFC